MLKYMVIIVLILVAMPMSFANNHEGDTISSANRFLSAEVSRQIDSMREDITDDLQAYQDENFQILDQRMTTTMEETQWKVLLATLGAVLLASGLVAYFLIRNIQNYSYEKYQEKLIQGVIPRQNENENQEQTYGEQWQGYDPGVKQMQSSEWKPQQSNPTVSTQFGQAAASRMTQMNQWQMQPAYDGSWQSPERPVSDISTQPAGYEYVNNYQSPQTYDDDYDGYDSNDPMQSPNWRPDY